MVLTKQFTFNNVVVECQYIPESDGFNIINTSKPLLLHTEMGKLKLDTKMGNAQINIKLFDGIKQYGGNDIFGLVINGDNINFIGDVHVIYDLDSD